MCPLLPEPENGFIIDSGRAVGSRANYFCNHGYSTRRTDVILRVCLPSGEWSGTDPMCICEYSFGTCILTNNDSLKTCAIHDSLSLLISFSTIIDTSEVESSCSEMLLYVFFAADDSMECEALPDIANGNVAMDTLRVGAVAEYTCDPGFTLTGPSSRTCLSGGEWSDIDSEPSCTSKHLYSTLRLWLSAIKCQRALAWLCTVLRNHGHLLVYNSLVITHGFVDYKAK